MAPEPRTMRGAAFSVFSAPSAEELEEAASEPEPEPELESESESEEPVSEEEASEPVLVAVLRVEEALEPEAEPVED